MGRCMTDKSKRGRQPLQPGERRIGVHVRLPEWLVQWMADQPETTTQVVEAAVLRSYSDALAAQYNQPTADAVLDVSTP